jgi:hypothetical protein
MSTICLEKIGSLILGPEGTIEIGPLPSSFGFQGPFAQPIDYYLSWTAHAKFKNSKFLCEEPNDDQALKTLKHEVKCFPASLARALKERPPPISSSEGYPLIHWDFLLHNVLFDEQYNVVGLPDWENTYSAPFEVFVAHSNMYSHFDSKALRMVPDEEGGVEYMNDVICEEEKMQTPRRISSYVGNNLCDISHCMSLFEEGKATRFSQVLDRYIDENY